VQHYSRAPPGQGGSRRAAGSGCLVFFAVYDGSGRRQRVRQFGTAESDVRCSGIGLGPDKSVYVAGYTADWTNGFTAWLSKYDAAGRLQWRRPILGVASNGYPNAIALDHQGNVFVAGETYGEFAGRYRGENDAWIAKLDATGRLQWKRQLGTRGIDVPYGVVADADGNAYLAGDTSGNLGGPHQGSGDIFVAKYSATGVLAWRRQFGTAGSEVTYGVATDSRGRVLVTGYTDAALAGPVIGGHDVWLVALDVAGEELYRRQFGTPEIDNAVAITVDGEDNVLIAGSTEGALAGPTFGGGDAYVVKFAAE
jgi:hypothetical protein